MTTRFSRRRFIQLGTAVSAAMGGAFLLSGCSDGNDDVLVSPDKVPLPQDALGRWWLSDNYAPVAGEGEAFELKVIGQLPRELNGLYARLGSNMENTDHWFLGHGMLHGVRLQDGQALWYRSRYINTELREAGVDDLNPADPASSFSNVAPVYHANRLLTMGEIGLPYEVSATDLSTVGVFDFGGKLNGSMTAHPKIDPLTGELLFFGYNFFPPYLTYYQANSAGELQRSVDITLPAAVMMHDFAITTKHVIFYDLPVTFRVDQAVGGNNFPFGWDDQHVPRMGVMPREGGDADVKWFEVDNGFIFHTMNAYENPDNPRQIIVHASRIDSPFWNKTTQDLSAPSYLTRYVFDLDSETVFESRLSDIPMDFGQLDRRLTGQPYRYGYGLDFSAGSDSLALPEARGIVRQDHYTERTERHVAAPGLLLGEALFVPEPGRTEEQSGWLMTFAFDQARHLSSLLIIDARDFTGAPIAKIELPFRVPFGFHGVWIADET